MPTNTYTPLANVTLASTASGVTFASIPATYRDLILIVQQVVNVGETDVRFNTDDGNNYSTVTLRGGADSSYYSANFTANGIKPQNSAGGTNSFFELQIMDYSATDKHKTTLMRSGAGSSSAVTSTQAHAVRWANTAAINTVRVLAVDGATYQIGSTFSLYGVVA